MFGVDRAVLLARACSLAFLPPSAIQSHPYCNGLQYVAQVEDPATQAGATLFRCGEETILACRGSSTVRNFRTNFNVGPAALETPDGPHPTAKVHAGFQDASAELWRRLTPVMPTGDESLTVVGHSLGGGTATLLALKAMATDRGPVDLVTYAGPRMGNGAFGEYYRERSEQTATHLVHEDDDVLKSNAALWDRLGFEHVGDVIRCDKARPCLYDGEDGATCIADPNFTERDLSLKAVFVDHCLYLGVYIGLRAQHPGVWLRLP